jgi:hypothetical protein
MIGHVMNGRLHKDTRAKIDKYSTEQDRRKKPRRKIWEVREEQTKEKASEEKKNKNPKPPQYAEAAYSPSCDSCDSDGSCHFPRALAVLGLTNKATANRPVDQIAQTIQLRRDKWP